MKQTPFLQAAKASIPVFFCYFPLGAVYGLLFTQSGLTWYYAPLFSFFVLAGAMQFLVLSLLGPHTSFFTIAISLIPLGIRNIFYGLSMKERFRGVPKWLKCYLAHGLVDATYSILMLQPKLDEKEDIRFITSLTVLIHMYWVAGTLFGAACNNLCPLPPGLEFSLTAFFAATLVEHFLKNSDFFPLYIGCASVAISLFLFPQHLFIGAILLAFIGCLLRPKKEELA